MSASIYNGKIVNQPSDIFTEGNIDLFDKSGNDTPLQMIQNAILNGKASLENDRLFISMDDYWFVIYSDGKLELGEGAA